MRTPIKNFAPLIILFLIFCCGVVADICVSKGFYFVFVKDLRDIVKIILNIQATIAVLSLSIMTLVGSFMDKSYQGIPITDFYCNKKNPVFTNLTVIVLGLIFILIGCISLIFNFYNTVIMLFVATLFIILWSTVKMYYVFKGDEAIRHDIDLMFEEIFELNDAKKEKLQLFKSYCNGWKSIILEQSEIDFQDYKDKFFEFYLKLLKEQDATYIKTVCNIMQTLARTSLVSSNVIKKNQGIKLVEDIYLKLRFLDFSDKAFLKEFVLISEVIKEFLESLQALPQDLREIFDWYTFIGCIDTIAITFGTKARSSELTASLQISSQMGLL